uniref:Uncharacterized protein n=1 Tax=Aureoumbra lagunensis TaxID=44058 RepID=A0A7S3NN68_9STRA
MDQEKWEKQLSSIIERTNANLTLLQRSRRRLPPSSLTSSGTISSSSPPSLQEERNSTGMHEVYSGSSEVKRRSNFFAESKQIDEDALYARLLARWEEEYQGERLYNLEEKLYEIEKRSQQAIATARSQETTVEALAKEIQSRRGALAKSNAWQADTEQWRHLIDKRLEKYHKRNEENDNLAEFIQNQGTLLWKAVPSDVISALEAKATSTVHATMASLARSLRAEFSIAAGKTEIIDSFASYDDDKEKLLESRLQAKLEAKLLEKQSKALGETRNEIFQMMPTILQRYEEHNPQQMTIDHTARKLLEGLQTTKDEIYSMHQKLETVERDLELQKSTQSRALEEAMLEFSAQSRTALTTATNAQERALDAALSAKQRAEKSEHEAIAIIEARHNDWQSEAAELRRASRRQDAQLERLIEGLSAAKIAARAYAEDAPGVKKAAQLGSKYDKLQTKFAQVNDRLTSVQGMNDHIQQRYGLRFNEIEKSISVFESFIKKKNEFDYEQRFQALTQRLDKFEEMFITHQQQYSSSKNSLSSKESLDDTIKNQLIALSQRYESLKDELENNLTEIRHSVTAQLEPLTIQITDTHNLARRALDNSSPHSPGDTSTILNGDADHSSRNIDGARLLALEDAVQDLGDTRDLRLQSLEQQIKLSAKMHNDLVESVQLLRRRVDAQHSESNITGLRDSAAIAAQRVGISSSAINTPAKNGEIPPSTPAYVHVPANEAEPPSKTSLFIQEAFLEADEYNDDDDDTIVKDMDRVATTAASAEYYAGNDIDHVDNNVNEEEYEEEEQTDDDDDDNNDDDSDFSAEAKPSTGVDDYLSRFRRRISSQGSLTPRTSSVRYSSSEDDEEDGS